MPRRPEVEADRIRGGLARVSYSLDRRSGRRRFRARWFSRLALALLIAGIAYFVMLNFSPWSPWATVKHILAFPNCSATRALGLAPAFKGSPGYWPQHDRDNDGIACEPWPHRGPARWFPGYRTAP
jgi:hypothetical protein